MEYPAIDVQQAQALFEILLDQSRLPLPDKGDEQWIEIEGFATLVSNRGHELYYAVSRSFYDVEYEIYYQAEMRFRIVFCQLIDHLLDQWGMPAFISHELSGQSYSAISQEFENEVYWLGCFALTYWCKHDTILYVGLRHEDKELPIMLVLGTQLKAGVTSKCD